MKSISETYSHNVKKSAKEAEVKNYKENKKVRKLKKNTLSTKKRPRKSMFSFFFPCLFIKRNGQMSPETIPHKKTTCTGLLCPYFRPIWHLWSLAFVRRYNSKLFVSKDCQNWLRSRYCRWEEFLYNCFANDSYRMWLRFFKGNFVSPSISVHSVKLM